MPSKRQPAFRVPDTPPDTGRTDTGAPILTPIGTNFTDVKNELNSRNAEGNIGSDIVNASWITSIVDRIQYGNKEDSCAGLRTFCLLYTSGTIGLLIRDGEHPVYALSEPNSNLSFKMLVSS